MARQEIKITIDGKDYTIHQKGATDSLKQLTALIKFLGVPAANAINMDSISSMEELMTKDGAFDLSGLVTSFAERLDENETINLIKRIVAQTRLGGKVLDENFDEIFSGDLKHLMSVVIAILKVEYASFLKDDPESQ